MLSVFPIQYLALFAYFLLRVTVGFILLYLGLQHLLHRKELKNVLVLPIWPFGSFSVWVFALAELTLGVFITIGMYTQVATLIVTLMSLKLLVLRPWFEHSTIPPRLFYFLLFGTCVCLTITGAGALAVDLPL